MPVITVGVATDNGMRKKVNEDSYGYFPPEDGRLHKKGILLVLADGMGGRSGGSLASKTAVEVTLGEYYKNLYDGITDSLELAFARANEKVIAEGLKDMKLEGMATTLTAVVLKKDQMFHAHVGDSRAYIIDQDTITPFTEDHSYVASLVKAGAITEEEALVHPQANLLTKAIGIKSDLKIDAPKSSRTIKEGDHILICCDGLYKVVPDQEIFDIVNSCDDVNNACEKLVNKANEYGGPDNITVLIARIDRINMLSRLMGKIGIH